MKISQLLALLIIGALPALGAESTALDALNLLPKGQAKNLAQIEAREGNPAPQRWHFLVHDKSAESGLKEYVVAGGELVATRELSQFAQRMAAEDVIGIGAIKFNSDQAAKLLSQHALANNVSISTINYGLRKEGVEANPVWHLTALDELGKELGNLVIAASTGTIIARNGFPIEPIAEIKGPLETPPATPASKRSTRSVDAEEQRPNPLKRVGGSLKKFFTGGNSR